MPRPSVPSPSSPLSASEPRAAPPSTARAGAASSAELQLAISRTGIGLELASPLALGPLTLLETSASLPDLRFPLDVSGGVARFRHRRGSLDRVVLEASRSSLEAWMAPRLRGVIGVASPRVMLFVRRGGATVGLVDAQESRCLAFEVELDADGDALGLSVHDARGAGLLGPATALAVRAVHAALAEQTDVTLRAGARFVLRGVAGAVARRVFPDRGARTPACSGLPWAAARGHEDGWLFLAQRGDVPGDPTAAAVVAREACALAKHADDAAFALDLEKARGLLVSALERAPGHRELSHRLAELDHAIGAASRSGGGRAEAALATLRDAAVPPSPALQAQLLRETGDVGGAIAAFLRAGDAEPVGPLAAMAFEAAATLTADPHDALLLLDRAVARAPTLPGPRWNRMARRLEVGRVTDATADAEHLHALAVGTRARHAVWLRAGEAFRAAGWRGESAALFERALRYAPRDAVATAGLGAALVAAGKVARGADLLTQAVALAEAGGREAWQAHIDLACVLADKLDDRPAAIARVREVPPRAKEALEARALEGRWRGALGDVAGAGLAFARARDLVEARLDDLTDEARRSALDILLEAAHLEGGVKGDWMAAQRHLGAALRVAPHDEGARAAYRDASRQVAGHARKMRREEPSGEPDPLAQSAPTWTTGDPLSQGTPTSTKRDPLAQSAPTWTRGDPYSEAASATGMDEAKDQARVDELTRKLHADPTDDAVVDELSTRLLRLGRTHELFALLAARLDEAGPARREALLPKQREVLGRLEEDARAAGREDEASLYRDAREML